MSKYYDLGLPGDEIKRRLELLKNVLGEDMVLYAKPIDESGTVIALDAGNLAALITEEVE